MSSDLNLLGHSTYEFPRPRSILVPLPFQTKVYRVRVRAVEVYPPLGYSGRLSSYF